jgi:hypothetical protein
MMATTATKTAPALKDWLEQVRTLAPEARIPYVAIILAEAYERGLTPQQMAELLPKNLYVSWNWCAKMDVVVGNCRLHANGSRLG